MGRKTQTHEQLNGGTNVLLSQEDYNEVGQLMTKHRGNNAQQVSYAYNERGWLSSSSAPLFAMQLNYNTGAAPQWNGNITSQYWGTPGSLSKHYDYTYDPLNRLTAGTSSEGYTENNIGYDPLGNITSLSRTGQGNYVLGYNYTGNQLTSVTNNGNSFRTYGYDANGNATSDGQGNTITYNMLNLPANVATKSLNYTYDATGKKLRKVSGTNTTNYIDGIQYDNNSITFVQTEEGRALNSGGNYTYEYSLGDHLGNTRLSFNQNGTTTQQDDYYPFGMEIPGGTVSSPKNEYLYNKKELQEELTQYDYGARFYDPVIAKWTSVDPKAEIERAWSTYSYVDDNPLRFIDPDGMAKTKPTYTAVLTFGAQFTGEVKAFSATFGLEINAVGFDLIGIRDSKFVFMEGKTQALGGSLGVVGARAQRDFKDKKTGDDKVEITKTTTVEGGYGQRTIGTEKIEVSNVDYASGETKTKTVSEKNTAKESWGFKLAAILGIEFSRDVVQKTPKVDETKKK